MGIIGMENEIMGGLLIDEKQKKAPKRGRPAGHRGADYLEEMWDSMNSEARRKAFYRHTQEIHDALVNGGIDNWAPAAFARALDMFSAVDETNNSMVDLLFSTRKFCLRRNVLIHDLQAILKAEWNVDLAVHAVTDVGLSHSMYQGLRNAFSKSIYTPSNTASTDYNPSAGMYSKRPWYTCPVTGTTFNIPEPFLPRTVWTAHMKESLAPMGLNMSADGKISERSFLETLRANFIRDRAHLKVFDVLRPAHPVFGIDHASISGARDFSQGGLTMGPCYKAGALLSEQKHVTLVVGQHHDDGKGLAQMLGPKPESESAGEKRPSVKGIAAEFQEVTDAGSIDLQDGSCIPCQPLVCLDFAAFRGITRKRGKCSALCACQGLASLQSHPGINGIPDS